MEINLFPNIFKMINVLIPTAILFFFFYKFFWKSIIGFFDKREKFMMEQVESAAQSNKSAIAYEKEANEAMKQARIDSKNILDRSKNEAIRVREEIVNEAKNEAKATVEGARIEIEREKELARKQIEGEIVDIALTAAREVVKDSINEQKGEEIVDDFIKELKA
ncbi:F-type H+-transporting ATPase subunit b [Bacilli bacterium PM5-3]|nr:F-type H+-transporting ATPase subunit b [Bacilli bacterium PM5-3]MDH6603987.1 F-type H+-transporting ATPase subunit b [Bacilli bacterium PM5-9]